MPDHDRIFKQLLTVFFEEFVQLFFPATHRRIDWSSLEFIDKELLSDQSPKKHVDLLAKVTTLDKGAMVLLIHLEHQAQGQANFAERMFEYFCYLRITYRLPVLPIALFSFARPVRPEADRFRLRLLRRTVVNFRFQVIQLNRLDWRGFVNSTNPLASALMAKMRIPVADRPTVKLQCLRLMLTLRLDPDRQSLIADFVNTYLVLNAEETKALGRQLITLKPEEAKTVQRVTNEWIREGERRGEVRGKQRGRLEERRQNVLKMHHNGLSVATIASILELDATEISAIIERGSK